MGKYNVIHNFLVLRTLFFWAILFINACADVNLDFLKCMSQKSAQNKNIIGNRYIHSPKSLQYSKLLKYAQKNGRWMKNSSKSAVRRPLFIVTPSTETQVQRTISCTRRISLGAAEPRLQIRVKSGGHDYEGLSFRCSRNCKSPFIMLDLVNLNSIHIDLKDESAWIQTGVSLGELYYAISKKSKTHAFPGGLYPTVGSGGIISGGGLGTLVRKYGLAADNVVDARIVNAEGEILDRKSMGEDLFWALKGGGGSASFGVILAWKLKLVRIPEIVTVFNVRREMNNKSIELLQKWERIGHKLPEDLFLRIIIQNKKNDNKNNNNNNQNKKIVQVSFQGLFLGKADDLVSLLNIDQNFPEFNLKVKDCFDTEKSWPWLRLKSVNCKERPCIRKECYQLAWIRSVLYFTGQNPTTNLEYLTTKNFTEPPTYYKAKSDFVKKPIIPAAGFKMIRKLFLEEDSPMIIMDPFGGKMSRISESDTPFPHREGNIFNVQYIVKWESNNSEETMHLNWMKRLYEEMKPFVSSSPRSAYVNYKDLDLGTNDDVYSYAKGKEWGEKYFKGNFERLAKVKSKVDPSNFFRNELTIPPFQEY